MLINLTGSPCPICGFIRRNIVFTDEGVILKCSCSICENTLLVTQDDINRVDRYIHSSYND